MSSSKNWPMKPKVVPNMLVKREESRRSLQEAKVQLKEALIELRQSEKTKKGLMTLAKVTQMVTETMNRRLDLEPVLFKVSDSAETSTDVYNVLRKSVYNLVISSILLAEEHEEVISATNEVRDMVKADLSELTGGKIPLWEAESYVAHIKAIEGVEDDSSDEETPHVVIRKGKDREQPSTMSPNLDLIR